MQDWDRYQSLRAEANESWRTGQEVIQGVEVSDWHLWPGIYYLQVILVQEV